MKIETRYRSTYSGGWTGWVPLPDGYGMHVWVEQALTTYPDPHAVLALNARDANEFVRQFRRS